MLCINFLRESITSLVRYPEEFDPENFFFHWPSRYIIQCIYQIIIKKRNVYHKYSRCTYLQDENFEVMHTALSLDKLDLACAKILREKPTGNDSGFITYSKKSCLLLSNCSHLLRRWQILGENMLSLGFKKWEHQRK